MKNLAILIVFTFAFGLSASANSSTLSFKTDTIKGANFTIYTKTSSFKAVDIKKNKKPGNQIIITVGSDEMISESTATTQGLPGTSVSAEQKNKVGPVFDKVFIATGSYEDIKVAQKSISQNTYTIKNAKFPLRLKLGIGKDQIDFELKEEGKWDILMNYKNN